MDRAVAKPILNCPRVVALISQRIAAGMPQHVDVNLKWKTSALTNALDQPISGIGGERGAALCLLHSPPSPFAFDPGGSSSFLPCRSLVYGRDGLP